MLSKNGWQSETTHSIESVPFIDREYGRISKYNPFLPFRQIK